MVSSGTDIALTVLGIIGNITSMGLFVSPMPTFHEICKKKTTGQYSSLPYVATLFNCMLWTFYGAPAVAGLIFVVSINVAGMALEATYIAIHTIFGTRKSRRNIARVLFVLSALYAVMVAVVLVVIKKHDRAQVVGSMCVILNVIMYASPLAVMKEVIRSQCVESMPFLLSFACFCNGLIWTTFGILKNDKFIYIPNGLGTILTLMQLVLWCIYYKKSVQKTSAAAAAQCLAIHVDKLQNPGGQLIDLYVDHHDLLKQDPRKSINENDSALMALCRESA